MSEIDPFVPRADAVAASGMSATTVWREQRAGRYPPFEAISARRKALRLSKLKEWQDGRRDWSHERERETETAV